MEPIRIEHVELTLVRVPLREPLAPYTSRLATIQATESLIVRLEDTSGHVGWGECNANFVQLGPLERLVADVCQGFARRQEINRHTFYEECPLPLRLRSAVEMALWDLAGRRQGQPVAQLLGQVVRQRIEVAACMGICRPEQAEELAAAYAEQGYRVLKIKAGRRVEEDLATVQAIHRGSRGRLQVRVDPNCGYDYQEALRLARGLEPYPVEYLEQPLPEDALAESARLRQQTRVPVALNESVYGPDSVRRILDLKAADVLVVETYQAGGVWPCVLIGRLAQEAGVPCVMHCGHDLGLKTAAMLHVAASSPAFGAAHDTTYYGLQSDIARPKLPIRSGHMELPSGPGLGVEVDPELLKRYALATASGSVGS